MTKHTPGPWNLHDISEEEDPKMEKPCRQWSIYKMGPLAYLKTDWDSEGEANARLIAAAPELLEALHLLMKAESMQDGERGGAIMGLISIAINAARAAIDKAEGRD